MCMQFFTQVDPFHLYLLQIVFVSIVFISRQITLRSNPNTLNSCFAGVVVVVYIFVVILVWGYELFT